MQLGKYTENFLGLLGEFFKFFCFLKNEAVWWSAGMGFLIFILLCKVRTFLHHA